MRSQIFAWNHHKFEHFIVGQVIINAYLAYHRTWRRTGLTKIYIKMISDFEKLEIDCTTVLFKKVS